MKTHIFMRIHILLIIIFTTIFCLIGCSAPQPTESTQPTSSSSISTDANGGNTTDSIQQSQEISTTLPPTPTLDATMWPMDFDPA